MVMNPVITDQYKPTNKMNGKVFATITPAHSIQILNLLAENLLQITLKGQVSHASEYLLTYLSPVRPAARAMTRIEAATIYLSWKSTLHGRIKPRNDLYISDNFCSE